jgi:hypothetical protein
MEDEKNLVRVCTHPTLRAPLLGGDLHAGVIGGVDWFDLEILKLSTGYSITQHLKAILKSIDSKIILL